MRVVTEGRRRDRWNRVEMLTKRATGQVRERENVSSAGEESRMYVMYSHRVIVILVGVLLVTSIKMPVFSLNFGLFIHVIFFIFFLSHNY